MARKRWITSILAALIAVGVSVGLPCAAQACGGMFSPEGTINQNGERVIIVQNGDATLSAIIQNRYEGEAEDFAWVLPVPASVREQDIEVVEDGDALFWDLEARTTPYFYKPDECYQQSFNVGLTGGAAPEAAGGAQSLGSGVVGPYSFDIVQSDDPAALSNWLRDNGYQFKPEMEPMVAPYIEQGMVFLAMRLRPGEGVDAIQPVKVTMEGEHPVIPMRMAAVAASPYTTVLAWFFADSQAVPANFEHIKVADDEIRYTVYGEDAGESNYEDLVNARIAAADGHAWLTEFAGKTSDLTFTDERLQQMAAEHPYLTRLRATLSPEQMTVDPVFDFDASQPDVPAKHDLAGVQAVAADCQAQQVSYWTSFALTTCLLPLSICGLLLAAAVGVIVWARRRRKASVVG